MVFASRDPSTGALSSGGCSGTFNVRGQENLLRAMERKTGGGPSSLVGTVRKNSSLLLKEGVVPGARVVATSGENRFETYANGFANYEFLGLTEGRYHRNYRSS